MKFMPEDIKVKSDRRIYWTRIYVSSDSGRRSTILLCASHNFIANHFHLQEPITETDVKKWMDEVLKDLEKNFEEEALNQPVHYWAYATTPEGKQGLMKFLHDEIEP